MASNYVVPEISCKSDVWESLPLLLPMLLELLVACSAFVKGEPVCVVIGNSVVFLSLLLGWLYLSQMRVRINFKQKVLVMCVETLFVKRIRCLDCVAKPVVCLAKPTKLFPRRVRLSFGSGDGAVFFRMPFGVPYSKGVAWCAVMNDYIRSLKGTVHSARQPLANATQ